MPVQFVGVSCFLIFEREKNGRKALPEWVENNPIAIDFPSHRFPPTRQNHRRLRKFSLCNANEMFGDEYSSEALTKMKITLKSN